MSRLLLLGLVLAASTAAGCGGPGAPSGLPVKDDFSNCSTGWSTATDEFVSLGCTDGSYDVLIKKPLVPQNARIFFSKGVTRKTNRIRGVCAGGGAEPTTLALYVNGKEIAVAKDPAGFDPFPGFGLFVFSRTGGADIRFDNFVARTPTQTELQGVGAVRQQTSTTASQASSKLCRRDGIRFTGTTAAEAEVCFTLTPDGSSVIETAFNFVRASGCPDERVGTTYSEIPGSVDAAGHVITADGLTATIRGATASGTVEDSTLCPGKTFSWTARRLR